MIRSLFGPAFRATVGAVFGGAKALITTFITVDGNDMTIFGRPLTVALVQAPPNTNPNLLLGSNGTAPTKTAVTPAGLAAVNQPTNEATRVNLQTAPSSSVGWTFFEPFLGTTFQGGLTSVVSGGTTTNVVVDGRSGVARLATGVAAAANQRAGITANATAGVSLGQGRAVFYAPCRPSSALFDNVTTTGRATIGFTDVTTTQTTDGVYFRHDGSTTDWVAVTRSNSVESVVATGVTVTLGTWYDFWIDINAAGTSALFYINGSLVATITTNIPIAAGRQTGYGVHIVRVSTNAVDLQLDADFIAARLDNVSLQPFE